MEKGLGHQGVAQLLARAQADLERAGFVVGSVGAGHWNFRPGRKSKAHGMEAGQDHSACPRGGAGGLMVVGPFVDSFANREGVFPIGRFQFCGFFGVALGPSQALGDFRRDLRGRLLLAPERNRTRRRGRRGCNDGWRRRRRRSRGDFRTQAPENIGQFIRRGRMARAGRKIVALRRFLLA